jgi:hypothetical protein
MKLRIRSMLVNCFCTVVCLGVAATSLAGAGDYPDRAIKIVVPAPPGPLLDVIPRIVAEKLSAKWGVPVIIENRPGAAQKPRRTCFPSNPALLMTHAGSDQNSSSG